MPEQTDIPVIGVDEHSTPSPFTGWIVLFLAAFILYAATANRGAQWQDSGHHILRIVTGESVHPSGLALSHPLHHWLGRFVVSLGLLEPCFAITLISAFAAAIAVANIYGCVLTLTRNRTAALLAAASLGLANTFWQMATLTESYTLTAALLSGECWCLAAYGRSRRTGFLWAMALLNGLGLANHLLATLTTPVLIAVVVHAVLRNRMRARDVAIACGLWLLGSLPYTTHLLVEVLNSGDLPATLHAALFGRSYVDEVFNVTLSRRHLLVGAAFVALNFPNLLLPAAVYGLLGGGWFTIPTVTRRALLVGLLIHALFVMRYTVVDYHTFFLPAYVLLCIFGGVGFAAVLGHSRQRVRRIVPAAAIALLALTPLLYAVVPTVARGFDVLRTVARNKPYRDDYTYLFVPWSIAERSAEEMSSEAIRLAGESGLILVEDPMALFALRYKAIRAGRGDVEITTDINPKRIGEASAAGRPVVLVPFNADVPATFTPTGSWLRVGDLYVLKTEAPQ